jgi:alkylated DNA repair protein (DNA oxidative demethylase)
VAATHVVDPKGKHYPNGEDNDAEGFLSGLSSPIRKTLERHEAEALLAEIAAILAKAPLYRPRMPRTGKPLSVLMSNCGPLGWVSDKEGGYRYQATHPETGDPWPPIPQVLRNLWAEIGAYPHPAEACLINYYAEDSRMGLHQDRDENDLDAPVMSVSLGDRARFRLGGINRADPTTGFLLRSGDVMMLAGPTRLAFHGVDRVLAGSSSLLLAYPDLFPGGGRINLTMRCVGKP